MTADKIAFAIDKMKEFGIVDSGDALESGIGVITDDAVKAFYDKLVAAGVVDDGLDYTQAYTTEFVGAGLGMDLKN